MKVYINIRVEDHGDHFQVYESSNFNGTFANERKLGNITQQDPIPFYKAEHPVYGEATWQNFDRALAYLISPRGMT